MSQITRRGLKRERVTAAVTRTEKRKVRQVAASLGRDVSDLLYDHSIRRLLELHEERVAGKTTPTG